MQSNPPSRSLCFSLGDAQSEGVGTEEPQFNSESQKDPEEVREGAVWTRPGKGQCRGPEKGASCRAEAPARRPPGLEGNVRLERGAGAQNGEVACLLRNTGMS